MASGRLLSALVVGLLLSAAACTEVRNVGTVNGPIQVLVWNNALAYGHNARVLGIPYLMMGGGADIDFDLSYAHTATMGLVEGGGDTTFDASVFTDENLDKYDVVLFLHTTGFTIDDDSKDIRRNALKNFIDKGRGFVGTHSATDTYQINQADPWLWYEQFVGTNYMGQSSSGTTGVNKILMSHPILTEAGTPDPWTRTDEWFVYKHDPRDSPGVEVLLTAHDQVNATERPTTWVHEMPIAPGAMRAGRMFYTNCCHLTSAFNEPAIVDLIIAGIKWAAHRL